MSILDGGHEPVTEHRGTADALSIVEHHHIPFILVGIAEVVRRRYHLTQVLKEVASVLCLGPHQCLLSVIRRVGVVSLGGCMIVDSLHSAGLLLHDWWLSLFQGVDSGLEVLDTLIMLIELCADLLHSFRE